MTEDDLPLSEDVGPVDAPSIETTDDTPIDEAPPPSLEDVAANMGWSPKDQWRGDPNKWKPAHEFVAATADINTKVTSKLKALEDQMSQMARTSAALMEQKLTEQRQQLLQERQEAFDIGDSAKFNEVDKKLQELPTAAQQPAMPPETASFVERHASWWGKDQEATAWAINRGDQLAQSGIVSPARQIAIVERELAQLFPEYAPQEKPKPKAVALTQPGSRGSTSRAKTFADLPKEAQQAAISYERKGVSREQYVKIYFEEQEA